MINTIKKIPSLTSSPVFAIQYAELFGQGLKARSLEHSTTRPVEETKQEDCYTYCHNGFCSELQNTY